MSVKNYAPELLALFQKAAQEEVRVQLSSHAKAVTYRHRLHNLRKAMRKEEHYLLSIAESVSFSIEGDKDASPVYLIARPADTEFVNALRNSGIDVSPPEDVTFNEPEPASTAKHKGSDALSAYKKRKA